MSDLESAPNQIPLAFHGFREGDILVDLQPDRYIHAYNLVHNGGDTLLGEVTVSPCGPLPDHSVLVAPFSGDHSPNNLVVAPSNIEGVDMLEAGLKDRIMMRLLPSRRRARDKSLGTLGVWELSLEESMVPDFVQPRQIEEKADGESIEEIVAKLRSALKEHYGEGTMPHSVDPEINQQLVNQLISAGFSLLTTRNFNPIVDFRNHEDIIAPFRRDPVRERTLAHYRQVLAQAGLTDTTDQDIEKILANRGWDEISSPFIRDDDPEEVILVGPTLDGDSKNIATVGIWVHTESYWKARDVWHIDTEKGYTLDTIPDQVPAEEKMALVKHLIGKGYVPKRRIAGIESEVDYVRDPKTVNDLARVGGAHPREVLELLGHIKEDDFVVGPIPKFDPETDSYVGLEQGPAVAFWGPADMTEAVQTKYTVKSGARETRSVPSIDAIRLERLKLALGNETIQA